VVGRGDADDVLDDRVGQQQLGGTAGLVERGVIDLALDLQLEALDLPDRDVTVQSETWQRARYRLALRVEILELVHDLDDDASHGDSCSGFSGRRRVYPGAGVRPGTAQPVDRPTRPGRRVPPC